MIIHCVWEHNGNDTLLYATNFVGAYTRGESLEIAKAKMPQEIVSYCSWLGMEAEGKAEIVIVGEKCSELTISDADSDVLFESEQAQLTIEEYEVLKTLALKSAKDFLALYESIPDKNAAAAPERKTFYGRVPRTANEMYEHTKNVNTYYFAEIAVEADHDGNIYECRKRGFEALESNPDFCKMPSEKAAMARIGHCVKSCAVLSGMTVSTQEPCIEWLQKCSGRSMWQIRFAFDWRRLWTLNL